jgi:hypothetical protein
MTDRRDIEGFSGNDTHGTATMFSGPLEDLRTMTGGLSTKKKDLWSATEQSEIMKPKRKDLWSAAQKSEIMKPKGSTELVDTEPSAVESADPAMSGNLPVTESTTTNKALPARYLPRRFATSSTSTVPTDGRILAPSTQPSETKVGNTGSGSTAIPKRYRRQNTSNQA